MIFLFMSSVCWYDLTQSWTRLVNHLYLTLLAFIRLLIFKLVRNWIQKFRGLPKGAKWTSILFYSSMSKVTISISYIIATDYVYEDNWFAIYWDMTDVGRKKMLLEVIFKGKGLTFGSNWQYFTYLSTNFSSYAVVDAQAISYTAHASTSNITKT